MSIVFIVCLYSACSLSNCQVIRPLCPEEVMLVFVLLPLTCRNAVVEKYLQKLFQEFCSLVSSLINWMKILTADLNNGTEEWHSMRLMNSGRSIEIFYLSKSSNTPVSCIQNFT